MRTIDLHHLGRERVIAAYLLDGCLIDPGPASTLDTLLAALGDERPERLLLTHIHLDHAGASGSLVRRWPDLEVWVHERGARHVADPSKLVASATRLYGDDMDRLWGEVLAVPQENLRVLGAEEREGPWHVVATPGHASHHVSYLHEPSGTAFCGDTAGVRIPGAGHSPVLAPTPPPDIDPVLWDASIDRIAAWGPERLALTHFGVWEDVQAHLAELREWLERMTAWAAELGDSDAFSRRLRVEIASRTDEATAAAYDQGMPPEQCYAGLERALRRVGSGPG